MHVRRSINNHNTWHSVYFNLLASTPCTCRRTYENISIAFTPIGHPTLCILIRFVNYTTHSPNKSMSRSHLYSNKYFISGLWKGNFHLSVIIERGVTTWGLSKICSSSHCGRPAISISVMDGKALEIFYVNISISFTKLPTIWFD